MSLCRVHVTQGHAGSEVVVQSGERVDLPSFPAKLEKVWKGAGTRWTHGVQVATHCTHKPTVHPTTDCSQTPPCAMQPMMEMVAGSNVWYQAHVLRATAGKLRVLFPGDLQPSCIMPCACLPVQCTSAAGTELDTDGHECCCTAKTREP